MKKKRTIKIDQDSFNKDPDRFIVSSSNKKERKVWLISPVQKSHGPKSIKKKNKRQSKESIKKFLRGEIDD